MLAADRRQLVSALANLLDNALTYSDPGSVVRVRSEPTENGVELAVIDHGIGIPARDLERIFERFYRVDRARSRETGGTGLGLAVVRHVATNHGGDVVVSSREGEGSSFTLRLPVRRPTEGVSRLGVDPVAAEAPAAGVTSVAGGVRRPERGRVPAVAAQGASVTGPAPAAANGMRRSEQPLVLVVDDEPSFVDALAVGLAREGFGVEVASDGAQALERFGACRPDVVLLDVMLPVLSGVDVCRRLRATSRVPIIMVSARSSEIDMVVGLEIGADDYVTKPYRLRELVARIRAVLRRANGDGDEPGTEPPAPPNPPPLAERPTRRLAAAGVTVDLDRREVHVDGRPVTMARKEFELLAVLAANAGRVLTREQLIELVWGLDYVGDTKTLDVHVKRLRAKVEPDAAHPVRLLTVRGVGYKFAAA